MVSDVRLSDSDEVTDAPVRAGRMSTPVDLSLWREVTPTISKMKETQSWGFSFGKMFAQDERAGFRLDVMEKDGNLIVQADVPGIAEEDIEVKVSAKSFRLIAKQPCPQREEEGVRMWMSQRFCGKATQEVSLPFHVDPDQVSAVLKEGILTVTAPKVAGTERGRVSFSSHSETE